MRRLHLLIGLLVGLAALWAAGFGVVSGDEESTETVDPSVVVLEPGENLIGWIGDSRSVSRLKRQASGIESVQVWDAQSRRLIDAESLEAGKGYVIILGDEEAVTFHRPMTPARGKVTLERGRNLVSWLGPDGWTIDRVVQGIGRSFIRAERGGSTYQATDSKSPDRLPTVRRGDALWIEVSRRVNWLQPAGVMPKIVFAGDADAEMRRAVRRDSIDAMEYFADEFAVQPDGSILTVYVAADVDSLIETFEADGLGTDGVNRLWYTAGGWANPRGYIVLKSEQWGSNFRVSQHQDGDYGHGRYVLVHEYYHAIQQQMSSTNAAQWLVEGGADWAEAGLKLRDAESSFDRELAGNRQSMASGDAPPLDHTERSVGTWHYTLGALASHRLALRSGE